MPKNAAHAIDKFFHAHGSPIAGMGSLFVKFSQRYGVNPYQLAATVMKETEGGLTGTGRRGQYNLTGMGGVGHMRTYPGYKASIKDSARNLGSGTYKGKTLAQQTALWVSGGPPTSSTAGYTNDIKAFIRAMGGKPGASGMGAGVNTPGKPPTPRTPRTPGLPAIPPVPGMSLQNPTAFLQQLGDTVGVPWNLQLPDIRLPTIPGSPAIPGKPGKPGKPGTPPSTMDASPGTILSLLKATQIVSRKSAGYSKATARGPLKNVSPASALDCSLSVAKVLQMAHLGYGPNQTAPVSGTMAKSWGKPGKGKFLTMYASNEHVFLEFKIGGKFYRFDTSPHDDPNQRSGPRLRRTQRSTAGFTTRHYPGL